MRLELLALSLVAATPLQAKDYIAAAAHPDQIVIVDTETMKVDRTLIVQNAGNTPVIPIVSPDKEHVYVLANKMSSVVKIDLETGENVGRIDMSNGQQHVRSLWGMALSPDGETLAVYQAPTTLKLAEYKVEPTRIAFYDARTLELKHTAPAPRQILTLAYRTDGEVLYAQGRAMYTFDVETGEMSDEKPIQQFAPEENFGADALNVWLQYETSDLVVVPYYTLNQGADPDDPEAWRTGFLKFDLTTGEQEMIDVEASSTLYFSATASPDRTRLYGVYNSLQSFDMDGTTITPDKNVELPHTYYSLIVSSDNETLFVGGAMGDIAAYDAETLELKGQVTLPQSGDMSNHSMYLFSTDG